MLSVIPESQRAILKQLLTTKRVQIENENVVETFVEVPQQEARKIVRAKRKVN
jgi:translation initiation factor 2 beta subunit (eIF-2beta)/eIF-5